MARHREADRVDFHLPPLADDPEYQAACDKLAALRRERAAAEAALLASPDAMAAAEALLAGEDARDEAEGLRRRSAVLLDAIAIQERRVADVRLRLSREACGTARSDYLRRLPPIVAALDQLRAAVRAEAEYRRALAALGYDVGSLFAVRPDHHFAQFLGQGGVAARFEDMCSDFGATLR